MNGKDYEPQNRSLLYVFTPPQELAPGEKVKIGFSFDGPFPTRYFQERRRRRWNSSCRPASC